MKPKILLAVLAIAGAFASPALAQSVKVENAWARATVPGQKTGSVYLDVTSTSDAALVAVGSPVAERGELHSTTTAGGVMRMRALPKVALPAGRTVRLSPPAMHVMLVGLKQPLTAGDTVPVTLSVQPGGGTSLTTVTVTVPVRAADSESAHHKH